jgi:hypothetical protein
LSGWREEDLKNRDIVLDRHAALANEAERIERVGETGLLRARNDSIIYWLLIDKPPPVSAENIVASCTSSAIREDAASCTMVEFYPTSDIIVSMRLAEELVPRRIAIIGDITKLVQSWEVDPEH